MVFTLFAADEDKKKQQLLMAKDERIKPTA